MNFAQNQLRNEIYIPGTWSQAGSSLYTQGNVGIGGTPNASYALNVGGNINFTGTLYQNGSLFAPSQWVTSGTSIYYTVGNVAIGTVSPNATLDVRGTSNILSPTNSGAALYVNGNPNQFGLDSLIKITTTGGNQNGTSPYLNRAFLELQSNTLQGNYGYNMVSVTRDVGTVGEKMYSYINGSGSAYFAGSVGIGMTSPGSPLQIQCGDNYVQGISFSSAAAGAVGAQDFMIQRGPTNNVTGGTSWNSSNCMIFHTPNEGVATTGPVGFLWLSSSSRIGMFYDVRNSRLGIGITNPAATLDIVGTLRLNSRLIPLQDGSSSSYSAPSARFIQQTYGITTNGVYWINLPTAGATQLYCIMDPACAGGGWILGMKATRGTTFPYSSTYWTSQSTTLNTTDNTLNDADAKYNSFNYFQATDWLALFPDAPVQGGDITGGYNSSWTWVETNVTGTTIPPVVWLAKGIQTTKASNGYGYAATNPTPTNLAKYSGSIWSNEGTGANFNWYGMNYTTLASANVRWGWAWNNETDQISNDIFGGIGLAAGSESAGDYISCCAATTGINRTMRVQWFIR